MRSEIENWRKKALDDLETAKVNLENERYDAAAFYSQQSVEKALKALYIKKFKSLRKTHDLVLLARELKSPSEIVDLCKELSPAYTYTRYPDVTKIKDIKKVSKKLIEHAEEVLKWIKKIL